MTTNFRKRLPNSAWFLFRPLTTNKKNLKKLVIVIIKSKIKVSLVPIYIFLNGLFHNF